jgi:hypothetical protein
VLYECASGSLNQAATNFERLAQATILRVPPELYLEQVRWPLKLAGRCTAAATAAAAATVAAATAAAPSDDLHAQASEQSGSNAATLPHR